MPESLYLAAPPPALSPLDRCVTAWRSACRRFATTRPAAVLWAKFIVRSALHPIASHRWYVHLAQRLTPHSFDPVLLRDHLQLAQRPFYDRRLTAMARVRLVLSHYDYLGRDASRSLLPALPLRLAEVPLRDGRTATLRLLHSRMLREGLLEVQLLVDGEVSYRSAVTVDGARGHLLLGNLQAGPTMSLPRLRALTRDMHGLQPRLLMLAAIRNLGCALNLTHVEAIAKQNHAFSSVWYRRRRTFAADYDAAWSLAGAVRNAAGNFQLPPLTLRDPSSYPSSKRAEIRRRHAVLRSLEEAIQLNVQRGRKLPETAPPHGLRAEVLGDSPAA